jgi:D-tyrosyl-tRNA(Tyr) deacylase
MRAVVQRVSSARVTVAGEITGEIDRGLLVLLGVGQGDTEEDARWLAEKIVALRIFEDADGG